MSASDFEYEKRCSLEKVGLFNCENKKVYELSGGQKQRVAIARALFKNPQVIFADEPTGNLDSENSHEIFKLLQGLSKERLVLVVCHDLILTREFADREIQLKDGKIIADINYSEADNDTFMLSSDNDNLQLCCNEREVIDKLENIRCCHKRQTLLVNFFPSANKQICKDFLSLEKTESAKVESENKKNYNVYSEKKNNFQTKIKLAVGNILAGKKRTIPTFICIWISSFVLFLLLTLLQNDFAKTVSRYLRQNNILKAVVAMNHDDAARNTKNIKIYNGKNFMKN